MDVNVLNALQSLHTVGVDIEAGVAKIAKYTAAIQKEEEKLEELKEQREEILSFIQENKDKLNSLVVLLQDLELLDKKTPYATEEEDYITLPKVAVRPTSDEEEQEEVESEEETEEVEDSEEEETEEDYTEYN